MTDKEIDILFTKQDIKLSANFNESIFTHLKGDDLKIDEMFSEQSLTLNADFNDIVLDEARVDDFFRRDSVKLGDSFCGGLLAKLKEEYKEPKTNIWRILRVVSSIAAVFLAGIFVANTYFSDRELLPENSQIYEIAKENINTEIDYFLLKEEMEALSQEIDTLEASILELESYKYTTASLNI